MKNKNILLLFVLCLLSVYIPINVNAETNAEVVTIGGRSDNPPSGYVDENNEVQGYEYEVLKAIDELLEDYEFEYQTFDSQSLLPALESGKIKIASGQLEPNKERKEKFLFSDESHGEISQYIITLNDSDLDPQTIDDLQGLRVYSKVGGSNTKRLEEYNETAETPIEIVYGEQNPEIMIPEMEKGNVDVIIKEEYEVKQMELTYGDIFKMSKEPIWASDYYFVFGKEDSEFRDLVDNAIAELKKNGKLDQLFEEFVENAVGDEYVE